MELDVKLVESLQLVEPIESDQFILNGNGDSIQSELYEEGICNDEISIVHASNEESGQHLLMKKEQNSERQTINLNDNETSESSEEKQIYCASKQLNTEVDPRPEKEAAEKANMVEFIHYENAAVNLDGKTIKGTEKTSFLKERVRPPLDITKKKAQTMRAPRKPKTSSKVVSN